MNLVYFNVIFIFFIFQSMGLVQDCGNSIADALELLQSCAKSSIL